MKLNADADILSRIERIESAERFELQRSHTTNARQAKICRCGIRAEHRVGRRDEARIGDDRRIMLDIHRLTNDCRPEKRCGAAAIVRTDSRYPTSSVRRAL